MSINKTMKTILLTFLLLATITAIGIANVEGAGNPIITLNKGIVNVGDDIVVYGSNFINNETITINTIAVVGGNQVSGLANGVVDENGEFEITFKAKTSGKYYIMAVGTTSIAQAQIQILEEINEEMLFASFSKTQNITVNEEIQITVISSILTTKNYIVKLTDTGSYFDMIQYEVLHNGIAMFEHKFTTAGNHVVSISVEGTNHTWQGGITIKSTDDPIFDLDYIITVKRSGTRAFIDITDEYGKSLNSGQVLIINPNGQINTVSITYGSAVFTLKEVGEYLFKFEMNSRIYQTSFTYAPLVQFSATDFNSNGITFISLMIDNARPSGERTVKIVGVSGMDYLTLYNGQGSYQAVKTGTYTLTLQGNITAETTKTWTESAMVSGLSATQDGDYLIVSGVIRGELSKMPKENTEITISIAELGTKSVITDDNGYFRTTYDIKDKKGTFWDKERYTVIATADNVAETNVEVKVSLLDYTWYYVGALVVFTVVAYFKGWLYAWTGRKHAILNPKKKAEKGSITVGGFSRNPSQFR